MQGKVVSTDEFWDLMGEPRFVRTSYHQGVIGDTTYIVVVPPEENRRLLMEAIERIQKDFRQADD